MGAMDGYNFMNLLHCLSPETAHGLALAYLALHNKRRVVPSSLGCSFLGYDLSSPIGLAAGADKNGVAIGGFAALGFGFLELGTITPRPQKGNRRPRIFRLSEDRAIINRLGFNNQGSAALAERIRKARECWSRKNETAIPIGVNVGANSTTLAAGQRSDIIQDYQKAIEDVIEQSDWITLNLSCPNVPDGGLAELEMIAAIIEMAVRCGCGRKKKGGVPLLVKLSPDATDDEFKKQILTSLEVGVDGFILSNTSRLRPLGHKKLKNLHRDEWGGLSGTPLRERSMQCLHIARKYVTDDVPIVSCGGISSAKDVLERLSAGASVVQLYSALVYGGMGLIDSIHREMAVPISHRSSNFKEG